MEDTGWRVLTGYTKTFQFSQDYLCYDFLSLHNTTLFQRGPPKMHTIENAEIR